MSPKAVDDMVSQSELPVSQKVLPIQNGAIPDKADTNLAKGPGHGSVFPIIQHLLKVPDNVLLRLNELLAPAKDLSSILSTFSYLFYLQVCIIAKIKRVEASFAAIFHALLRHDRSSLGSAKSTTENLSSLGKLSALLYGSRLTLRLFGLPSVYAQVRQLLRGTEPGEDRALHTIALVECALYGAYRILESVAFLTDVNVIPRRFTARWFGPHPVVVYTLAYRAWFVGVACNIIREFREAQRGRQARDEHDGTSGHAKKTGDHWYSGLVVLLTGIPIVWHFSAMLEEGLPGFGIGIHGAACALADLETFGKLWHATKWV